jgi:hypothetical protein
VSGAAHDAHDAPASGAAQFEQNFPVAGVPQAGQSIAAPGAGGEEAAIKPMASTPTSVKQVSSKVFAALLR